MNARTFFAILPLIVLPVVLGRIVEFERDIWPIFQKRCIECHQAPYERNGRTINPKAGLRLDGLAHIMFGSEVAEVIVPNHPSKSSLYLRTTLAEAEDDRMPPKGDPLTLHEQDLIRSWIGQGVDFGSWLGATDGTDQLRRNKYPENKKIPEFVRFFQKLGGEIVPKNPDLISEIEKSTGLLIRPIGDGSPLLEARVVTENRSFGDDLLPDLLPLADVLVRLDLRKTFVSDAGCRHIAELGMLVELNLRGSEVGDDGLRSLARLSRLKELNLGQTRVSSKGVIEILQIPALSRLYLWNTGVSTSEISQFGRIRPDLLIVN